jgi:hypothetical protein
MFKNFFKKKKKEMYISLEEQLDRLGQLGISLSSRATIEDLLNETDREEIESKPYLFLLIALGCEFEKNEYEWVNISDNIWYLDTECIEDNGDYIRIINRLTTMSQRAFELESLVDFIDIEAKQATISFKSNGEYYNWSMEVNDDWLDMSIFSKVNTVLDKRNSEKKFFVASIDQSCLVVFL